MCVCKILQIPILELKRQEVKHIVQGETAKVESEVSDLLLSLQLRFCNLGSLITLECVCVHARVCFRKVNKLKRMKKYSYGVSAIEDLFFVCVHVYM